MVNLEELGGGDVLWLGPVHVVRLGEEHDLRVLPLERGEHRLELTLVGREGRRVDILGGLRGRVGVRIEAEFVVEAEFGVRIARDLAPLLHHPRHREDSSHELPLPLLGRQAQQVVRCRDSSPFTPLTVLILLDLLFDLGIAHLRKRAKKLPLRRIHLLGQWLEQLECVRLRRERRQPHDHANGRRSGEGVEELLARGIIGSLSERRHDHVHHSGEACGVRGEAARVPGRGADVWRALDDARLWRRLADDVATPHTC